MKKYSLRRILLENVPEEPIVSSETTPPEQPLESPQVEEEVVPSTPVWDVNSHVTFTKDLRGLDLGNYRPVFVSTEVIAPASVGEEKDSVLLTKVTFQGPSSSQKLKVQNRAKTAWNDMKATDFSEFMSALYFAEQYSVKTAVGGPSQHYDVDDGKGGAWEVKSLGSSDKPSSALTGVGGREILGGGGEVNIIL